MKEHMTDQELIELYFRRDERAIRETDRKYGKMLFGIAYRILQDRADCEECQNDTYLRVWNRIPPARPAVFSAFLTKIMRDTAVDRYKEKTRKKRVPGELTVSLEELADTLCTDDLPEAAFAERELGRLINEYMRTLPERERYIFIERYYFAAPLADIADELHIGTATVHRDLEKIKRGLKAHLERNGVYV